MSVFGERLGGAVVALRRVVRQRGLRRLLAGWALSITGEWIFVVALAVYAFRSGGAVAVGLVGLIRMMPAAILAPLVTTAADRGRRRGRPDGGRLRDRRHRRDRLDLAAADPGGPAPITRLDTE